MHSLELGPCIRQRKQELCKIRELSQSFQHRCCVPYKILQSFSYKWMRFCDTSCLFFFFFPSQFQRKVRLSEIQQLVCIQGCIPIQQHHQFVGFKLLVNLQSYFRRLVATVDQPKIMCPGHVWSHDFELYCHAVIWVLLLINNLKDLWTSFFFPFSFPFIQLQAKGYYLVQVKGGKAWAVLNILL